MIEQLQARIEKLKDVGQHAFNGTDYSFGFNTWKSVTMTLLRKLFPNDKDLIQQIQNIDLHRVNYNRTDSTGYNLEACKNEAKEILQILIETNKEQTMSPQAENNLNFWSLLHPRVTRLAQRHFDNGLFADAVLTCLRDINTIIKNHVRQAINQELDGAPLMTRAFSVSSPIIAFDDLTAESGRNIQIGYMKIFEGAMIGIRNPKAHANLYPDRNKAIHFLFLSSFMFLKLEETGIIHE